MECNQAIEQLLHNDTETSLKALDAFGKVPAGVLVGNYEWLGDYDECSSIQGLHYCHINFGLNLSSLSPTAPESLGLRYGVCVPKVCSADDIIQNIDNITQLLPVDLPSIVGLVTSRRADSPVNCQDFPQRPYDAGFICFTIFCSSLAIMMILGTILDVFQKSCKSKKTGDRNQRHRQSYGSTGETNSIADEITNGETAPLLNHTHSDHEVKNIAESNSSEETPSTITDLLQEVLLCFAFTRNIPKLLDTKIGQSKSIGCLHGIRVFSIMWVVLGHVYVFQMNVGVDNGIEIFTNVLPSFAFQAVGNAYSSVDTFFFMSGFLLVYLTFTKMAQSDGKISWLMFYFHRIWRITPLYAFVILFVIYYHPYFGEGPNWFKAVDNDAYCEKYWWRNLLYINNMWSAAEMCIAWSWYLSCDMQFFIISPLILFPLFRSRTIGLLIASIIFCASLVATGVLIGQNEFITNAYGLFAGLLPAGSNLDPSGGSTPTDKNYGDLVYFKPYSRITPYIIGMVMGYIFYQQRNQCKRIRLSPVVASLGWALAFAVGISVIYGTYPSYTGVPFESTWSNATNIIYGTFSRSGWVLAVSWVIFACYYGYGGWINDFLSWSFFIPLSRLTYSAYLLHGLVIQTNYYSNARPGHVSAMSAAYMFCGSLVISYAAAGLFSIAIEYPCAGLEKLMFRRKEQNKEDNKAHHIKSNGTTIHENQV